MRLMIRLRRWTRALLRRDQLERGMTEEMRLHIDLYEDYLERAS